MMFQREPGWLNRDGDSKVGRLYSIACSPSLLSVFPSVLPPPSPSCFHRLTKVMSVPSPEAPHYFLAVCGPYLSFCMPHRDTASSSPGSKHRLQCSLASGCSEAHSAPLPHTPAVSPSCPSTPCLGPTAHHPPGGQPVRPSAGSQLQRRRCWPCWSLGGHRGPQHFASCRDYM